MSPYGELRFLLAQEPAVKYLYSRALCDPNKQPTNGIPPLPGVRCTDTAACPGCAPLQVGGCRWLRVHAAVLPLGTHAGVQAGSMGDTNDGWGTQCTLGLPMPLAPSVADRFGNPPFEVVGATYVCKAVRAESGKLNHCMRWQSLFMLYATASTQASCIYLQQGSW